MATPRPSYLLASATKGESHQAIIRDHVDISSSGSQNAHTRAGACPNSPISPSSPTVRVPVPGPSKIVTHPRFASASHPPGPPQQEISEKVRDAFEDLELGQLSPVRAEAPGRSHERSRSRSRGRKRDRSPGDASLNEKRALSERYGDATFVPSASQCNQAAQVAGPALTRTPVRSSSLSNASFAARPPFASQPTDAAHLAPPPYSPHPSCSVTRLPAYPHDYSSYSPSVRRMLLIERLRPWLPFILYAATSLGFVVAIAFWKEEVFGGLDDLARWLRAEGETGYAVMFFMIFLTCIREYFEDSFIMHFKLISRLLPSSDPTLLNTADSFRIYLRCLDWSCRIIFLCPCRCSLCLLVIAIHTLPALRRDVLHVATESFHYGTKRHWLCRLYGLRTECRGEGCQEHGQRDGEKRSGFQGLVREFLH